MVKENLQNTQTLPSFSSETFLQLLCPVGYGCWGVDALSSLTALSTDFRFVKWTFLFLFLVTIKGKGKR